MVNNTAEDVDILGDLINSIRTIRISNNEIPNRITATVAQPGVTANIPALNPRPTTVNTGLNLGGEPNRRISTTNPWDNLVLRETRDYLRYEDSNLNRDSVVNSPDPNATISRSTVRFSEDDYYNRYPPSMEGSVGTNRSGDDLNHRMERFMDHLMDRNLPAYISNYIKKNLEIKIELVQVDGRVEANVSLLNEGKVINSNSDFLDLELS